MRAGLINLGVGRERGDISLELLQASAPPYPFSTTGRLGVPSALIILRAWFPDFGLEALISEV